MVGKKEGKKRLKGKIAQRNTFTFKYKCRRDRKKKKRTNFMKERSKGGRRRYEQVKEGGK